MWSKFMMWFGFAQQGAAAAKGLGQPQITPTARFMLELIMVLVIVAIFTFLGSLLQLDRYIGISRPALRHYWLGLLVLLVYLMIRMALLLSGNIKATRAVPDIDNALDHIVAKVRDAKLDIRTLPIHVVVGTSPAQENYLSQCEEIGRQLHVSEGAFPVHCYGNSDGLWLFLPHVSAVSRQAAVLEPLWVQPSLANVEIGSGTLGTVAAGHATASSFDEPSLRPEAFHELKLRAELREEAGQRMRYFARQLRQIRQPYCPLNSIMICLPFPLLPTPGAGPLATALQTDMVALQETLGVKCLTMVVLNALEYSPSFSEYIRRLPEDNHKRRVGCAFPSFVTPTEEDGARLHHWLRETFDGQVQAMFGKDVERDKSNEKLFNLLQDLVRSRDAMKQWMNAAFPASGDPTYCGGVYFASFSKVGPINQPFLSGLIGKVQSMHDELIGWTDDSLRRHREQVRWAMVIGTVAVTLILGATALVIWAIIR